METQHIVDYVLGTDIRTLIVVGIMLWYSYRRQSEKIKKLEERMDKRFELVDKRFEQVDKRFEQVDRRFDKIEEKITDIDRRLCRLEGAFSSKDCCMIKDSRLNEKAE